MQLLKGLWKSWSWLMQAEGNEKNIHLPKMRVGKKENFEHQHSCQQKEKYELQKNKFRIRVILNKKKIK